MRAKSEAIDGGSRFSPPVRIAGVGQFGCAQAGGGRSFSRAQVVPGSVDAAGGFNGSGQGILMNKLAMGSDGAVAVVNSSLLLGAQSRVWMIRGHLRR